jgi:hypothetical protein
MRERGLTIVAISVILLGLLVDPLVIASAGTRGYFPCVVIRFFEPCPDVDGGAADGRPERGVGDPAVFTDRRPRPEPQALPIESIWAEPGRSSDGRSAVYLPPRPVREFLEAPTAERALVYLAWNQHRLDAVARAAEVLGAVTAAQPPRTIPAPATCVAPAEAGSLHEPRSPDLGPRATGLASADRRLAGRGLAIVYAFASWCLHSARQTPIVAAWARTRPDLPILGLLLDSPPGADRQLDPLPFPVQVGSAALRDQLGVRGYPTILFLRDGVPVQAVSGVTAADRLEALAHGLGT